MEGFHARKIPHRQRAPRMRQVVVEMMHNSAARNGMHWASALKTADCRFATRHSKQFYDVDGSPIPTSLSYFASKDHVLRSILKSPRRVNTYFITFFERP